MFTSNAALVLCIAYSAFTCNGSDLLAIGLYGLYKTVTLLIEVLHACDQQHFRMDYIGQSLALQGIGSLLSFCALFPTTGSLEIALIGMTLSVAAIGIFL